MASSLHAPTIALGWAVPPAWLDPGWIQGLGALVFPTLISTRVFTSDKFHGAFHIHSDKYLVQKHTCIGT